MPEDSKARADGLTPSEFIKFLDIIEKMKCNTRHSWTSSGRHESVAEHSFRLSVMAFILADEFPEYDMEHVLKLCLVHDFGEAVTGDIPSFEKTDADDKNEDIAAKELVSGLPQELGNRIYSLLNEFYKQKTPESRLARSLDKLEAVIQHNEADLSTWIPLEYELNTTYGQEECSEFPYLKTLRAILKENSLKKIKDAEKKQN